jgi:hypothetical protein
VWHSRKNGRCAINAYDAAEISLTHYWTAGDGERSEFRWSEAFSAAVISVVFQNWSGKCLNRRLTALKSGLL